VSIEFRFRFVVCRQLKYPNAIAPPFKYGTVPYGSAETNLMTHYPKIYSYMKKYSRANAIEGVKAVKEGSVVDYIRLVTTSRNSSKDEKSLLASGARDHK